ncbi:MAG: lysophospholipase [Gammaproteobacteria bacterium]|nr:lysophospholipase [Gammaproteobacteria bacterium]
MPVRKLFAIIALIVAPLAAAAAELERHTVMADGHPVALWEKSAADATEAILLVHGRTWSALPDFDLQLDGEDLSMMDSLADAGYAVYAVDLRGYGETPRDETGWLTPNRAADDVAIVIAWIAARRNWSARPHLFGWSMGSTISQLMVQRHPGLVASLILFGYWRDVTDILPADAADIVLLEEANTAEAAASDFITPGSISQAAIDAYVAAALAADPIRVDIRRLDEYNALDGAKVTVPTLVIAGEFDPLAPADHQVRLLLSLATGHKQYVSVPGGDHAALLERSRDYFIHEIVAFLQGIKLAE